MRGWSVSIIVALVSASVLAACSTDSGPDADAGTTIVVEDQQITSHGELDVGGQTAEDMNVGDSFFEPTVLAGSGGQQLSLSIANPTQTLHNFSLPEQHFDEDIPAGQTVGLTVIFPANGQLVFFCKYHRSIGMLGVLKAG